MRSFAATPVLSTMGILPVSILRVTLAGRMSGTAGVMALSTTGSSSFILATSLAAAVIGRLERFGMIVAASIALGVINQSIYWHTGRAVQTSLVLLVVVIGALLLQRKRGHRTDEGDASSWRLGAPLNPRRTGYVLVQANAIP